jgi:hypothetical protein
MKHNCAPSILIIIFFSTILFASPTKLLSQRDLRVDTTRASSNNVATLQISLLTDKTSYSTGDEIHFEVVFLNRGDSPLRIMIDDTFIGSNIECTDIQGNKYLYTGGYSTWSPKVGVYTGKTYLLASKGKMNIKMDALVTTNYQLIFSNLFDRKGSTDYQEIRKQNNLPSNFPDKYISAGRIISLPKPNTYRFAFIYETTNADKKWKFAGAQRPQEASIDLLWIGKAASNPVEILIK